MRMYLVSAVCGHTGNRKGIKKTFAVRAENGKEAARVTRQFPRVKHDYKYAILDTKEVTTREFLEQETRNSMDPFFRAHNAYECQKYGVSYDEVFDLAELRGRGRRRRCEAGPGHHRNHRVNEKSYKNHYTAPDWREYQ